MANYVADPLAQTGQTPPYQAPASQYFGKLRVYRGRFTIPSGGLAVGDTIEICKFHKGMILAPLGRMYSNGLGSGVTVTYEVVEPDGNVVNIKSGVNVAAAGYDDIDGGSSVMYEATKEGEHTFRLKIGGASATAGKYVDVWPVFVQD